MSYRSPAGKRRSAARSLFVLAVVLLVAVGGAFVALPRLRAAVRGIFFADTPGGGPAVVCRNGNPLAGVYNPARLGIRTPCLAATGHVVLVLHAPDGDVHLSLLPDRGYWHLLDRRNYTRWGGTLVVEVVPADQARVRIPSIGDHVRVTGAYVTDLEYGWREIHPAWQIVPAP